MLVSEMDLLWSALVTSYLLHLLTVVVVGVLSAMLYGLKRQQD